MPRQLCDLVNVYTYVYARTVLSGQLMSTLEGLPEMSKNSSFWSMFTRMSMQEQYFLINVYAQGLARDVKKQFFSSSGQCLHVCLCKNSTFWSMSSTLARCQRMTVLSGQLMFSLHMQEQYTFWSMSTLAREAKEQHFLVN